jgi:hypothetical protein
MLRDEHRRDIVCLVIAMIAAGAALRLVLLIWGGGTMIDDAYITARYARNLVAEGQLVYNAGEQVLGVSGPLYALWAALHLLVVPARHLGYALGVTNTLFFAATALALFHLLRELSASLAALTVLAFAGYLRFADNSIVGMETPLFMLGVVVSLLLLRRGRLAWLSLITALLMLVRPEGALWAVSVLAVLVLQRRRLRIPDVVPGVAVIVIWVLSATAYYGSPIPRSVLAKSGWLVPERAATITERMTAVFASLSLLELPAGLQMGPLVRLALPGVVIVSLLLFILGVRHLARRKSLVFAFPVLFIAYFAFYTLARGRVDFSWYGIPSGLAYLVTVLVGLMWLARRALRSWWSRRLLILGASVAFVVLVAGSVGVWRETRLPYFRAMREGYEPVGEFITRECPADAQVLVTETGMIGWRAERVVHETAGIVSPEILRYYREAGEDVSFRAVLDRFGTDIVVLDPLYLRTLRLQGGLAWVDDNYEVLAEFPSHSVLRRLGRPEDHDGAGSDAPSPDAERARE